MPDLPKKRDVTSRSLRDDANRRYLIVKSNNIVQKTHYSMTLAQQKVLASLIRSIKPHQHTLTVKFSTKQYMRMLGLHRSGTTFGGIMHTLKQISDKSFYMKMPDGKYHLIRWIQSPNGSDSGVIADPNADEGGDFLVSFNPALSHYLFNQSLKYKTIYKFSDIMLMRSRYSPRLFEIFRSNQTRQKVQKRGLNYKIGELKYDLNLMKRNRTTGRPRRNKHHKPIFKYPSFTEFRRNVLEPAKRDINTFSEYNVHMKFVRAHGRGRKVVAINVSLVHKNKKQKKQRDDRIFFITHHIPKSQWKTWREDTIRGRFHQINPRNRKSKKDTDKSKHEVTGHYRVLKPSTSKPQSKHAHTPNTDEEPNKKELKELDDYLGEHKVPFKEVNMGSGKIKYYNPWAKSYVWTSESEWKKYYEMYIQLQEINKKGQEVFKKFRQSRVKRNK